MSTTLPAYYIGAKRGVGCFGLSATLEKLALPSPYRTSGTTLTATAVTLHPDGYTKIDVTVGTPGGSREVYDTTHEQDGPIIARLLGEIACVDMSEFRDYPQVALQALKRLHPQQYGTTSRQVAQKTFDPERTESQAVHLTIVKMSDLQKGRESNAYTLNFGRPLTTPEGNFVYWQHVGMQPAQSCSFQQYRRTFHHANLPPLGEKHNWAHYQENHYRELTDAGGIAYLSAAGMPSYDNFETSLRAAGNILVGPLTGFAVNRLIYEPLTAAHRLHMS